MSILSECFLLDRGTGLAMKYEWQSNTDMFAHSRTHAHTNPCVHIHARTDRYAWPFIHAVDWKKLEIPEYPFIVAVPMDLTKVEARLFDGFYPNASAFARDVCLTFENAKTFNAPEDKVSASAHASVSYLLLGTHQ